jgi:hypothetical protein
MLLRGEALTRMDTYASRQAADAYASVLSVSAAVTVSDNVEHRANSRRRGKGLQSQQVIEHWIQLYNCLTGASYRVTSHACAKTSETDAGVVCADRGGHLVAVEHALVEIRKEEAAARCLMIGCCPPGSRLIRNTLEPKLRNLSATNADKRILLLENDSVSGSIEDQYACVRNEAGVKRLRTGVDEIWSVLTAILDSENLIFANRIDPADDDDSSLCSLNVITGEFWRLRR